MTEQPKPSEGSDKESVVALIARIETWEDAAYGRLERMGNEAELTGDYAKRDEYSADCGEKAWELLDALISAVKKTL